MKLTLLAASDPFPPLSQAWSDESPAPGLLAVGGSLSLERLRAAYRSCIFPWYSDGQPILWWSPDPRMVLDVADFRLHRSLVQSLKKFRADAALEIRVDYDFAGVIQACSGIARNGQDGTWIVPDMQAAYLALHQAGSAHSIEVWKHGTRVGGLYCVAMGKAVFGESMFSLESGASKVALAALVAMCRRGGAARIDCQQNTAHLASLGAREMPRAAFAQHVAAACLQTPMEWHFEPLYWSELLPTSA